MFVNQIYWPVLMFLAFSLRFQLNKFWISSETNCGKMTHLPKIPFWGWMQQWICWVVFNNHFFSSKWQVLPAERGHGYGELSLSPVISNIFMEYFETLALGTMEQNPSLWLRYFVDTFVIWPQDLNRLQDFCNHINGTRPTFKFTMEIET